jgi:hypothetical protein
MHLGTMSMGNALAPVMEGMPCHYQQWRLRWESQQVLAIPLHGTAKELRFRGDTAGLDA